MSPWKVRSNGLSGSAPVVAFSRKFVNVSITRSPASNARKRLKPPVSANGDFAEFPSLSGKGFLFIPIMPETLEKYKNFDIIYIITIYEMRMSWSILSH